jgi:cob(I)alamin adenosyltransferase
VVTLAQGGTVPIEAPAFLNRLSDLLFVLARLANHRASVPDVLWQPQRPELDPS